MSKWRMPAALPVEWEMRSLDSAKITAWTLGEGRFRHIVEHAPRPDGTPPVCLWYLEQLGSQLHGGGSIVQAYGCWDPRDHIFFKRPPRSPRRRHRRALAAHGRRLVWTVEMSVGRTVQLVKAVTQRVVRRRMGFLRRWREVNAEEAGNLAYFLPELYFQESE
jgi:hypothetical protein